MCWVLKMKIEVDGRIVLSDILDMPENEVREFFREINNTVLKKGVPKGAIAPEINSFSVDGNEIKVNIISDRHVRAPNALLRIKKAIGKFLSKYKIGVRKVVIDRCYVEIEVDNSIDRLKLPYATCKIESNTVKFVVENIEEQKIEDGLIDKLINLVKEKSLQSKYKGKTEFWKLEKKSNEKKMLFDENPTKKALELGWISEFPSIGQWIFTPPITKIFRTIEKMIIENIAVKHGFQEAIYPKLIPLEIYAKTGHLKGSAHEMYFAEPPIKRDSEIFEEFYDYVRLGEIPKDMLREKLKPPLYGVCYAQCEPFYQLFSGKIVKLEDLPLKFFDRSGPSFRWESGGVRGLERVNEFHRIEFTYIGAPQDVVEIRDALLKSAIEIVDKKLDLEWRVAQATPVYLAHEGRVSEEKGNFVHSYDLEVYLPFRGGREESNWLEITSFHVHEDHYVRSFKIKEVKKRDIWTGCTGFGLERWLVGFLAEKGFEIEKWPEEIKNMVGELPKPVNFVK